MRPLLCASMVMLLVSLAACSKPPAADAGYTWVAPDELAAELTAPRGAGARPLTLVDVREPELYAAGHIPGAINIPWPGVKDTAATTLDRSHAIVMICHGGPMGDDVAERLVAAGFTDVRNLAGGMRRWKGPLESGG